MDLSFIEHLIPDLAAYFNVEPATALLLYAMVMLGFNIVSRLIPDSATGALGMLRKFSSVVGARVANRVLPGKVTAEVIAADALNTAVTGVIPEEAAPYLDDLAVRMAHRVLK